MSYKETGYMVKDGDTIVYVYTCNECLTREYSDAYCEACRKGIWHAKHHSTDHAQAECCECQKEFADYL